MRCWHTMPTNKCPPLTASPDCQSGSHTQGPVRCIRRERRACEQTGRAATSLKCHLANTLGPHTRMHARSSSSPALACLALTWHVRSCGSWNSKSGGRCAGLGQGKIDSEWVSAHSNEGVYRSRHGTHGCLSLRRLGEKGRSRKGGPARDHVAWHIVWGMAGAGMGHGVWRATPDAVHPTCSALLYLQRSLPSFDGRVQCPRDRAGVGSMWDSAHADACYTPAHTVVHEAALTCS